MAGSFTVSLDEITPGPVVQGQKFLADTSAKPTTRPTGPAPSAPGMS